MSHELEPYAETSFEPGHIQLLASIAISLKRIADRMGDSALDNLGTTIRNAISSGIWDARPR